MTTMQLLESLIYKVQQLEDTVADQAALIEALTQALREAKGE